MELVGLGLAVERARAAGLRVIIATPRVQKAGEEGYDRRFERLRPDGILARHLGAVEHVRHPRPDGFSVHGDFSLNATNALTARTLLEFGLTTLTPAYDLDLAQLLDLCAGVPAERLEVTIHQHLPLFHNEHCVYSHLLSNGHDYRDCGRPCEKHLIRLRDGLGMEHPVIVDAGCRNTVFNPRAQSAAACLPQLLGAGVRRMRVEIVRLNEVVPEGIRVLDAAASKYGIELRWDQFPWSCEWYQKHGKMMPEDGIAQIRKHDAIFLGAVGFPGVPDHVSLWGLLIPIRRSFH